MDEWLDRRLLAGAWLLAAILIAGVALSFWNSARILEDARGVAHTEKVLVIAARWLHDITDAESWARKFIMSGENEFARRFEGACDELDEKAKRLAEATENAYQRALLTKLEETKNALVAMLQEGVRLRRTNSVKAETFLTDRQNILRIGVLRRMMAEFQEGEHLLLALQEAQAQRSYETAIWLALVNVAAGLAGVLGVVWTIRRSVAARLQQAAALEQSVEALAQSNAELERFAYVASHDLQEPLRAVSGCVQILRKRYRGKLDESADELIRHTTDGAVRMQNLIRDLLAYSRVATQAKELLPIDSTAAVRQALSNLEVAVKERRAVVTVDPLPVVKADLPQLTQVFQNLLVNAIKFTTEGPPTIHVSAQRDQGAWRLSVQDNGIGIAPEYVERIFVIFQRLHTREEFPGTGIGLAICRKVVERHGGRMWVESEPGKGATFFFTIPEG